MSIGAPYLRIGIGDKEIKNYMSINVYQLVESGEGDVFTSQEGSGIIAKLRSQTGDPFFAIPVSDIVEEESNDSTV